MCHNILQMNYIHHSCPDTTQHDWPIPCHDICTVYVIIPNIHRGKQSATGQFWELLQIKISISISKRLSFLQSISHAKCYEELLVKGRHPLLIDRPLQDATRPQHAPAEEE